MHSSIKLIVDEKTSHLRELIVNQKVSKRKRSKLNPRKHFSSASYKHNSLKWSAITKYANTNSNSSYNYNTHGHDLKTSEYGNNACAYDHNARGYDYIRQKSANDQKPKGIVTNELQKHIENLCTSSRVNFNKLMLNYKIIIIFNIWVSGYKCS